MPVEALRSLQEWPSPSGPKSHPYAIDKRPLQGINDHVQTVQAVHNVWNDWSELDSAKVTYPLALIAAFHTVSRGVAEALVWLFRRTANLSGCHPTILSLCRKTVPR